MPQNILEWGIEVIVFLQGLGDWLIWPLNLFTPTGHAEFYFLVLPLIYWSINHKMGSRIAILLLVSIGLSLVLKMAFHGPRPYWYDPQVQLLTNPETTFGIPSSHAQQAMVLWGLIAIEVNLLWVWIIMGSVIFLTGFSRMYLGVHFPTDVLLGWTIGFILLYGFYKYKEIIRQQFQKLKISYQISAVFLFSMLLIISGVLIQSNLHTSWQIPADWIHNAANQAPDSLIDPLSLEDIVNIAAVFLGFLIGIIWLNNNVTFQISNSLLKNILRYVVGVIGVLLILEGIGALFSLISTDGTFFGYVLRYIRYSLAGAWISVLAPLTFIKLKLT